MAKKFYSDITKKIYDTEEDLEKDEKATEEKTALIKKEKEELALARKASADEIKNAAMKVNEAYKVLQDAQKNLVDKKRAFIDKYGSYHYTTTDPNDPAFDYVRNTIKSINEYFDSIFNPFRF